MRRRWERTDRETGSATSARDTVECDRAMTATDSGLCGLPLRAVSHLDSRPRSWYVFDTTPISSAVGSRPSSGTVSVFVWE